MGYIRSLVNQFHDENQCLNKFAVKDGSKNEYLRIRNRKIRENARGGLPDVGYTGMCHQPGSIFHLQKSRTGPKFLKFYSRTGPTF